MVVRVSSCFAAQPRGSVAKTEEGHSMNNNSTFGVCSSQGEMDKLPLSVFLALIVSAFF